MGVFPLADLSDVTHFDEPSASNALFFHCCILSAFTALFRLQALDDHSTNVPSVMWWGGADFVCGVDRNKMASEATVKAALQKRPLILSQNVTPSKTRARSVLVATACVSVCVCVLEVSNRLLIE